MRTRPARRSDIPELAALIERSVRLLQRDTYTPEQIELALAHVYGVDTVLVDDGTYFAVEDGSSIVACGGWSRHATLYGGDVYAGRTDDLLDPEHDAAKIRAFFVLPEYARRGLASSLLERCECEAAAAGFTRLELGATLAGVPFYAARGYVAVGPADVSLPDGGRLEVVRMERRLKIGSCATPAATSTGAAGAFRQKEAARGRSESPQPRQGKEVSEMPKSLAEVASGSVSQAAKPFMGHGVCSFPNCNANNDGGPCTFYSGTADRCLNCDHPYSYHA